VSRDDSLDAELDRLYALPLGEFTAARNALARELKASDAEAAKRVRELKKPTRSAAAINRAVRGRRKEAGELLAAADDLRETQERLLKGGDRGAVEDAASRERAAIDRFMTAVEAELESEGGASEAMLERARATLRALPGDPDLRREFEAGRITTDHEAVGFGALSVGAAPPPAKRERRPAKKEPRAAEKGERPAEKREARRRLKRAERDLDLAERRLRRAKERAEKAREQLDAANMAVAEAEDAVAEATRSRDAAASSASAG
jgi:hypothetical protein